MYCGSFDWFSVKNSSGPRTQHVRNIDSWAKGLTRRASHAQRQFLQRARAGTIQGNAATETIGK